MLIRRGNGQTYGILRSQNLYFYMRWLVDGYNVILSDEKLAKMLRNENEAGRGELISEIANSLRFKGDQVTLFFDGRFGASSSRESTTLVVRFTARGETADDVIKREIGKSSRRRSLFVVSNDHSIVNYARECGATAVSSAEFLAKVRKSRTSNEREGNTASEKPESNGRPDPELLKLFTGKKT
jgi:predicted RNA-binding protein with PIN domain